MNFCTLDNDCQSFHHCIINICERKDILPPDFGEIIGLLMLAFFTGLSSVAGNFLIKVLEVD